MKESAFYWLGEVDLVLVSSLASQVLTWDQVLRAIDRHAAADWGDLSVKLRLRNDENLECRRSVLSRFKINEGEAIWIGTNPDKNFTLIMVESELR